MRNKGRMSVKLHECEHCVQQGVAPDTYHGVPLSKFCVIFSVHLLCDRLCPVVGAAELNRWTDRHTAGKRNND